ncbi:hypothetical protein E2542_SST21066 [Spatholobus suberectus]|nr:hypothetical protein E2542_SST21066 [Spatholobus suberectus]
MLPKLRILDIQECNSLEYVFPVCFARGLVSLEQLRIYSCDELKYVFGSEKEHHLSKYQRQSQHQTNIDINLPSLEILHLDKLPNLVDTWPRLLPSTFTKFESLTMQWVSKIV